MLNRVFQALAHPDRRQMLQLIKAHGELNASEIADRFDCSKPTLSHHLKALTDAELLVRERRGQFIYFQINQSIFEEVLGAMFGLFDVQDASPITADSHSSSHTTTSSEPDSLTQQD